MKSVLTVVFAFAFAGVVMAQGAEVKKADPKPCDMKTVEKAPVCAKCSTIDPKCDDKGMCCGGKPETIEVCVKITFSCADCKKACDEGKPCCKDAKCEKKTSKCHILIKCEACGAAAKAEGDCANADCKKAGKKCKKCCEWSGKWPHGGEMPKK
jgi:hypothetical protein